MWKQRELFNHKRYVEKSTWKWRGIFYQQNYIEKVRANDVEIRQNLTYQCNIDIEFTFIRQGVSVAHLLQSI